MARTFVGGARSVAVAGVAMFVVVGAAACSSSGSSSSTTGAAGATGTTAAKGSLSGTIQVVSDTDLTGAAAFAGIEDLKGEQLAVQQVNSEKYLGSATISLQSHDTQTNPQTAASLASQGVADSSVAAILGPEIATESAPMATIAQQAKVPILFTQSGGAGVVIGNDTYRVTALQTSYFDKGLAYLQEQGVKKISTIYNSANSTIVTLATQTIPAGAGKYGYQAGPAEAVSYTTEDYSGVISKVLASKPDCVAVLVVGAANPTVVTQLRQAGYTGIILGQQGDDAGTLKPAGAAAKGVVWMTDFSSAAVDQPAAKAFSTAFKAKFGTEPTSFAAEGYDETWMLARGIKAAGSAQRAAIAAGLATVAKQGFGGAEGQLTFDGNQLVVPGILVGWNGTDEILEH
jgi:branched-chain amino acid transport system substrate-binding protein